MVRGCRMCTQFKATPKMASMCPEVQINAFAVIACSMGLGNLISIPWSIGRQKTPSRSCLCGYRGWSSEDILALGTLVTSYFLKVAVKILCLLFECCSIQYLSVYLYLT